MSSPWGADRIVLPVKKHTVPRKPTLNIRRSHGPKRVQTAAQWSYRELWENGSMASMVAKKLHNGNSAPPRVASALSDSSPPPSAKSAFFEFARFAIAITLSMEWTAATASTASAWSLTGERCKFIRLEVQRDKSSRLSPHVCVEDQNISLALFRAFDIQSGCSLQRPPSSPELPRSTLPKRRADTCLQIPLPSSGTCPPDSR
ncbi:hypothetical protein QBC40DRAFT_76518 [Triangularia verruculosa]|uniref:Uncharacterized protein n=1 Tax=Triangularia verruculosa TaxID=2587418 RepID=A0AAN6XLR7_9PEZI|nr:hypothetical protein QBC40DRAFT_76518 [Triangularia verruculosa]